MNTMRNLIKDNNKLENDILRKENEHAFGNLLKEYENKGINFQGNFLHYMKNHLL